MKNDISNFKHKFYWNLSYTGLILFLILRIPITNILGNEGNGFLAVSFGLYTFLCLFFGQACACVTSRMVKECLRKKHYRNGFQTFIFLLVIYGILSAVTALLLYAVSDSVLQLLNMKLSGISFRVFGIFLVLQTLVGVFRGYFEGCGTGMPTYFSRITEGVIAGISGIILSILLKDYGSKVGALLFNEQFTSAFGAAGVAAGCICGSVLALLFLFLVHQMYRASMKQLWNKDDTYRESPKSILIRFGKTASLVFLELLFFHLYRVTDLILYIRNGSSKASAANYTEILGAYYGKAFLITGIFTCLLLSITGKNKKRIKRSYEKNKLNHCWKYVWDDSKQLLVPAACICVLLLALSEKVLKFLFHSATGLEINMLRIGSFLILFMALGIYLYGVLKTLEQKLMILLLPLISYVIQTAALIGVLKKEALVSLSLPIAELVFWISFVILAALVICKELRLSDKKQS